MLMTSRVPVSLLIRLKHHNNFSSPLEDKSKLLHIHSAIKKSNQCLSNGNIRDLRRITTRARIKTVTFVSYSIQ